MRPLHINIIIIILKFNFLLSRRETNFYNISPTASQQSRFAIFQPFPEEKFACTQPRSDLSVTIYFPVFFIFSTSLFYSHDNHLSNFVFDFLLSQTKKTAHSYRTQRKSIIPFILQKEFDEKKILYSTTRVA